MGDFGTAPGAAGHSTTWLTDTVGDVGAFSEDVIDEEVSGAWGGTGIVSLLGIDAEFLTMFAFVLGELLLGCFGAGDRLGATGRGLPLGRELVDPVLLRRRGVEAVRRDGDASGLMAH